MSKVSGAILAQVVQRRRNGDLGTSDLTSLVDELASSDLTEAEIAKVYSEAFDIETTD